MAPLRTRWTIFSSLFIVVAVSYVTTVQFKGAPAPPVLKTFEYVESLPESTSIIVSFDHEASSLPEIQPISLALIRHLFRKNLRIIGMSLFAEGTAIGYETLTKVGREFDKKYGEDFVFLGFKPQHISAILAMGESIKRVFPEDYLGQSVVSIPVMKGIDDYGNIAAVISIADGDRAVQWIEYGAARYNVRIIAGVTAAMITSYDPYLGSGQLYSMVGGLKGAAEYENLYGKPGGGNRGMLAQTTAHIFIILMIIIGNVIFFRKRFAVKGKY